MQLYPPTRLNVLSKATTAGRFTDIYQVLTADPAKLTLGEASFWLSTARKTVNKIPVSSRSDEQGWLSTELLRIHNDLGAVVEARLKEQADTDDELDTWVSSEGDYTDDPINSSDKRQTSAHEAGSSCDCAQIYAGLVDQADIWRE